MPRDFASATLRRRPKGALARARLTYTPPPVFATGRPELFLALRSVHTSGSGEGMQGSVVDTPFMWRRRSWLA